MSDQTRLLLDKNVVRRYFEGISALEQGAALAENERQSILLVHLARKKEHQVFLPLEAFNLLQAHKHRVAPAATLTFLKRVQVLYPSRYFKRWARRLRNRTFTREDAKLLALGTFGTDVSGKILGVHTVVTFDQPMLRKWELEWDELASHLLNMTSNLQVPFVKVKLPKVRLPKDVGRA
jgi:hypothetical protein